MSTPRLHHFSRIGYGSISQDDVQKRGSFSYKNNALVFIFDDLGINYDKGWDLLKTHFEINRIYYECSLVTMRQKPSDHTCSLIIEAHFREHTSQISEPSAFPKNPPASSFILKRSSANNGYIQLFNNQGSNHCVIVRSTLPKTPIYRAYQLNNTILGVSTDQCFDIKEAIHFALCEKYMLPYAIPIEVVVDVLPGYTSTSNIIDSSNPGLFNGSFHVIIDTSYLPSEPTLRTIKFKLYGDQTQWYLLDNPTSHYLYCTNCKTLDSHVLHEKKCSQTWHEYTIW